jgi:hypothetical protein
VCPRPHLACLECRRPRSTGAGAAADPGPRTRGPGGVIAGTGPGRACQDLDTAADLRYRVVLLRTRVPGRLGPAG